jgi:hypothetical protein
LDFVPTSGDLAATLCVVVIIRRQIGIVMSDQSGQFLPPPGAPIMPPTAPGYGVAPSYPPTSGPVGKPRGIGACIGLAIITLGIYSYVWTWKTHEEIKQNSGSGVGGALGFVIYFVFSPVTFFLLPHEVSQMLARAGRPSRVKATTGLWILLPIAGSIVWFVKVQGQLNEYWRSLGATG